MEHEELVEKMVAAYVHAAATPPLLSKILPVADIFIGGCLIAFLLWYSEFRDGGGNGSWWFFPVLFGGYGCIAYGVFLLLRGAA